MGKIINGKDYSWLPQIVYDVWGKLGIERDDMRTLFRARYRSFGTPDVTCPITGKQTRNQTDIHEDAWLLVKKGLEAEESLKISNADKRWYAVEYGQIPRWNDFGGSYSSNLIGQIEGICQLAGIEYRRAGLDNLKKDWDKESWLIAAPETRPNWDLVLYFRLSPTQHETFLKLWKGLQWELDQCSKYNAHSGKSLLVQLAKGEASIEDYNMFAAKTEGRES